MELKNLFGKKIFGLITNFRSQISNEVKEKILMVVTSFVFGFVSTKGMAFGRYSPFSVAAVAAVPKGMIIPTILGAFAGYFLGTSVYLPIRYVVSILAVGAIRWAVSELQKVNENQFFSPVVAFLPLFATGFTVALINSSLASVTALYIAESLLAGGTAYFFVRTIKLILNKNSISIYDNADIVSVCFSVGVLLLSFEQIAFFDVSLGRIIMVLIILSCAKSGGIIGGAVSGVSIGTIAGISGLGLSYLSGAYGLGGLVAGVFSPLGKIFVAVTFSLASGVASLQIDDNSNVLISVIEVSIATVAFMFIPESHKLSKLFIVKKENLTGSSLRNNVIMKLNHASVALEDISLCVDEISDKLTKSKASSIGKVYNNAVTEICTDCALKGLCWNKNKQNTVSNFAGLTQILKVKGRIDVTAFRDEFAQRCNKTGEIRDAVNKNYKSFLRKQSEEIKSANMRDITGEQFKITAIMLTDMASEIIMYENFDDEAAEKINEVFRKMKIFPVEICCRIDKYGRMSVEAEIEKIKGQMINKALIVSEVSKACGRFFAQPCVSSTEFRYKIQMCEKPKLDIKIGMSQKSAALFCGDSALTFYDGQGRYIAMVSDGMGTGGMAAVDGAMSSSMMESMLKAGIGYDTALRMVNSALMSKCDEETLATMDITTVDLFTGECEFRKAGGAMTVIKKGKKVLCVEEDSVPIGIMQDVKFTFTREALKKGDMIVMISDGVTACGTDWVLETVLNYIGNDPEELANELVSYSVRNRNDGHKDDVTALVILIDDEK